MTNPIEAIATIATMAPSIIIGLRNQFELTTPLPMIMATPIAVASKKDGVIQLLAVIISA